MTETSYEILQVSSICDRERAYLSSIKKTVLSFLVQTSTTTLSRVSFCFWKITRENLKSNLVLVVVLVPESKGPFLLTTVNYILFRRFTLFKKSTHHKLKSYIKSIFNAIFCHHFWCFLCSSNVLSTVLKNEEWLLRCYATKFATVRPINLPMKKRYMSINILQCTLC